MTQGLSVGQGFVRSRVVAAVSLVAVALGVLVAGTASVVNASSYLRLDGVTVDPIQVTDFYGGGNHYGYTGPNLAPGVQAPNANLEGADLTLASLSHADLSGLWSLRISLNSADLSFANLSGAVMHYSDKTAANLRSTNLTNAILRFSTLNDADLTNANLTNANMTFVYAYNTDFTDALLFSTDFSFGHGLSTSTWTGAKYSLNAKDNFGNPIADTSFPVNFDPVSAGMIAVPEPNTALLLALGITGLAARQRQHRRGSTTHRD